MVEAELPVVLGSILRLGRWMLFGLLIAAISERIASAQPATAETNATAGAGETTGGNDTAEQAAPAPQPEYDVLPLDPSLKPYTIAVTKMVYEGRFGSQGDKDILTAYYEKYVLPQWTDPKVVADVHKYRIKLRQTLQNKRPDAGTEVHDHLNVLVLESMKKLVAGHFHPTVRINAMIMIGDLNSVEGNSPTPLPAALDVLLAAASDAKLDSAIRVAALVGLTRHAVLRIADPEARRAVTAGMLKLLTAETSRDDDGQQWLVTQAMEVLGRLESVGESNAVFQSISKVLTNKRLLLSTRTVAAESLGGLKYTGATGINLSAAVADLEQLALDACDDELRATDGGKAIMPRRIRERLAAIQTALDGDGTEGKGLATLAREAAQQTSIAELKDAIKAAMKVFDESNPKAEDLKKAVEELRAKLEQSLKKAA